MEGKVNCLGIAHIAIVERHGGVGSAKFIVKLFGDAHGVQPEIDVVARGESI